VTKSLPPSNATAWERSNSAASDRLLALPVEVIRRERDPARCDGAFVAPLGWERSVHYWRPTDDAGNRARVASSFVDHLNYGCPAPLEAEIALDVGVAVKVREFFEIPRLVWPEFMVDVAVAPGDPQPDAAPIRASALRRKPPRDVFAGVRFVAAQPSSPLYVGAASAVRPKVKILPFGLPKPPPQLWIGAASRMAPRLKVLPLRT
jgi:hypothetical protein